MCCAYGCRLGRDIWGNSFQEADGTSVIPLERWDVTGAWAAALHAADGSSNPSQRPVQFGVFLPAGTAAAFDAAAFGLSATEALLVDPQQRLLLEAFAEAYASSNSGSTSAGTAAASCGVFVGISSMDYQKLASRYVRGVTAYSATGVSLSVAAGRLSYSFGLQGPALAIDTACSSSLVAANTASMHLRSGGVQQAAAAGANLTLSPDTPAMFSRAGMLSPEGRCKTLDAAADGYVRAEAVGVMMLQAYAADVASAAASSLAVLVGSAVNQDGRSSSLTAPNGPAQQEVLRAALADGGLTPAHLTGLSMHGTGTPLGEWSRLGVPFVVLLDNHSVSISDTGSNSNLDSRPHCKLSYPAMLYCR
jgi:acyl transferase domain-containing protein